MDIVYKNYILLNKASQVMALHFWQLTAFIVENSVIKYDLYDSLVFLLNK